MESLAKQLADAQRSGVYHLIRPPEEIERAAKQAGLAIFRIDARPAQDKDGFLTVIAKSLQFPAWFGNNWDALTDCLRDLEWLRAQTGYVCVLENVDRFATQHPDEFGTANQVFETAAEYWKTNRTPFLVFIATPQKRNYGLRTFS